MPADLDYLLQARRNRYAKPAGGSRASGSDEDPRAAVEEEAFQAETKRLALAAKEQQAAAEAAAKAYEKGRAEAEKEAQRARNNEMEAKARREKRPIYTDANGLIQSQYTDEEWAAQKERKAKNDALRTQYFKEQRPWVEDAEGNMIPRHTDEQWQALQAEKVAKEKAEQLDDQAKAWRAQKGQALANVDDQTAQVMRGLDLEGQDLTLQHKGKLDTVKKANAQIKLLEQEIENGETEGGQILDGAAIAKRTAARQALVAERDKVQAEADAAESKVRAHEVRKLEYSRANNEVQGWLQREKNGLRTEMPPVVMGVKGGAGDVRPEPTQAGTTLPGTGDRNRSQSQLQTGAPSTEAGAGAGRSARAPEEKAEAVRKAVIEGQIAALAEDDSLSDEERKAGLTRLMLQRDDPQAYETQVLQEFEGLPPEKLNEALDAHVQDFEQRKQGWQARRDALRQQTQAVNAEVDNVLARNAQRLLQPHKAADLIEYTTADGGKVSVFRDLAPQLEQAQEKAGTFEQQNQAEMDRINAEGGELERAAKLIHAGGGVLQKKQEVARGVAQAERRKVYEQLNTLPGAKLGDELAQVDAAVAKHQGGDDASLHEWAAKEREKIGAKADAMQQKLGPAVEQAYAAAAGKMPAGVDLNAELDRDPMAMESQAAEQGVETLLAKLGMARTAENRAQAVKMLRDAAVLDWSRGDTSAPVRTDSTGRVLVNPENWTDDKSYAAAVAGAGASDEQKAKALEMQPELKAQAIQLKLDTLRTLGVFNDWEETHAGLSPEEKLKQFEKENSGVFNTGAWKVRWNQALLGVAQGVLGLAQSATGLAAVVSDDALALNRRLGQDAAQLGAASQALPTGQWVNQGASMLVSSAPSLAVGGAVGTATRSELLALHGAAAAAGAQTFGQVYGDAVQGYENNRGLTTKEARKAALVPALASGVATYALTAAGGTNGMESVLRQEGFKQGLKQWLQTVGKGAFKEGVLEEAPDQLIQGVIARHNYDPTKSWGSIWEETMTAAVAGAVMGGGFEMMSGAGGQSQNGLKPELPTPSPSGPVVNPVVARPEPAAAKPQSEPGTTILPEDGTGDQSQLQTGAPSTEGETGSRNTLEREQLTKEAEAELASFAPEGMSAATVAATKAKAEVLLRMAQGETLQDFTDEELRQVGLNRDGTPGYYETVLVDKKDPQAGRTSVWKKGVRGDGFQPVVVEDGELIITQRQIENLKKRLPAVAARIGKSEVERRREIRAGKVESLKSQVSSSQTPEAVKASPGVLRSEPAQAGTTILPETGDQSQLQTGAPSTEAAFDPVVEARVDEISAELAGRGLSGEQALQAARGVVQRMGVMGPKYEVQMIDPAFDEAMKAEGFQRDPAKMSRWMVRGQFKAETRGEKPVMRKAEPAEAGTTLPGTGDQSRSQLQTGAPSTEEISITETGAGRSARAPLRTALIERSDWKQAQGEVIAKMQSRAKGLPEAGKKAAAERIKGVVKRFNKVEELIDTKFGRLFEGVRIVPNGSLPGGGLAAQVTGYDAQGRATGVELLVDPATFAEAGGITDAELERALNEEWQHRADLMVMSRSEAIDLAKAIHAAQPGVFNAAWKQYFAVGIKDGSVPAKPPVELTDDEAYMLYFEASRMIRQGTFTSENAAIRDVGLLQRMYLMLSRYVNFVRREMKKLPQELRELWEDRLTAAEAVMRKTKEAGLRLQKEELDDVEPPESAQPQKAKVKTKPKPVNEDEEAMAMAADAEMDVRPERQGALRNPGENAIRGMAAIPDPDTGKENVVVWINRYHGRITRPSKGWLARMAQDGKDRSKIGDWDDIQQAEIPSFYAGLVFKNGNGSTLDQALQELHGLGYFPGVAAEDVTGEMLARKIKDVINRYQAKKQGGATTVQDEEQAHFERLEAQRVEFERSTAKGPIYVKPHEMQPGDVMMVKADDGKMHRVEVLRLDSEPVPPGEEFDPDANPAQFMGPDGPMEIRRVTLRDGTTFGVQTIDGQQGLYVDAFSVRQEGDFYAGLSDAVRNRTIDDADAVLRVMQHEGMDASTPFSQIVLAIQQNLRVPMIRAQKMLGQVMDTEATPTVYTNEELMQALQGPLFSPRKQGGWSPAHYTRVIPRDFFNEGKALTMVGRLAELQNRGELPPAFKITGSINGAALDESGDMYINGIEASYDGYEVQLTVPYNSGKESRYPLYFTYEAGDVWGERVFNEDGMLSEEFRAAFPESGSKGGKLAPELSSQGKFLSQMGGVGLWHVDRRLADGFEMEIEPPDDGFRLKTTKDKIVSRGLDATFDGRPIQFFHDLRTGDLFFSFDGETASVFNQGTREPSQEFKKRFWFKRAQGGTLSSPRKQAGNPFYSKLEQVIEQKMPNRADAKTVVGIVSNPTSAVKAEELKWSGIVPWVQAQAEPVSKAAVLEYLRTDGAVRLEEVDGGTRYGSEGLNKVLPGGNNYREVVLAMPAEPLYRNVSAKQVFGPRFKSPAEAAAWAKANDEPTTGITKVDAEDYYKSSHFSDVPNYVAHMRLNDRPDSEGKEGTFIEEIQSDRHQAGREKGYREELSSSEKTRLRALQDLDRRTTTEDQELTKLVSRHQRNLDGAIPDAPFRTTWPLQMFKRALAEAVSAGKQWIGWTTGETQADRYDMSQQVDAIKYMKVGDTYTLQAEKNGQVAMEKERLSAAQLADYVGKELAQKIVDGEGETSADEDVPEGVKVLSGDGLKVGGEGMKGFYDNILPKEIGKYVKQWGAGVQKAELIGSGNPMWASLEQFADEVYPGAAIDDDLRAAYARAKYTKASATPFWKVDITPQMRAGVEAGQALFAPRKQAGGFTAGLQDALRSAAAGKGRGQVSAADIVQAYQAATVGQSSVWQPIGRVFERMKETQPDLTPETFMRTINALHDEGRVLISPVERLETVQAAKPFVVGAAGVEMTFPPEMLAHPPVTHVMPDGYVLTEPGMNTLYSPRKRAHHGTPHKVKRFSTEKIGTGEGVQAYGWGLYFASSEKVAIGYRDMLDQSYYTVDGQKRDPENPRHSAAVAIAEAGGAVAQAIEQTRQKIARYRQTTDKLKLGAADGLESQILPILETDPPAPAVLQNAPNLYTVELLPDEEEFLDWDKPLSEQSEKVKQRLNDPRAKDSLYGSAAEYYRGLVSRFANNAPLHLSVEAGENWAQKFASEHLASLGIPGIRYLDGNSRQKGKGTHNYVLFDDKLVRILEENGKPVESQVLASPRKQGQSRSQLQTGAPSTEVDAAAHEAATSPRNDLPEPTEAQKEAGNYAKGHVTIGGHEISIENPAGSRRRAEWPVLRDHYGYLKGTKGQDGDQVDVFVKPGTPADYAGPVFVVRQNVVEGGADAGDSMLDAGSRTGTGAGKSARAPLKMTSKLDEYKVMLGYATAEEARAAYLRNYTPGWPGLAKLTTHTMPEFEVIKRSVFGGDVGARATDKALASARKQGQGAGMADPEQAAQNAESPPGGLSEARVKAFDSFREARREAEDALDDDRAKVRASIEVYREDGETFWNAFYRGNYNGLDYDPTGGFTIWYDEGKKKWMSKGDDGFDSMPTADDSFESAVDWVKQQFVEDWENQQQDRTFGQWERGKDEAFNILDSFTPPPGIVSNQRKPWEGSGGLGPSGSIYGMFHLESDPDVAWKLRIADHENTSNLHLPPDEQFVLGKNWEPSSVESVMRSAWDWLAKQAKKRQSTPQSGRNMLGSGSSKTGNGNSSLSLPEVNPESSRAESGTLGAPRKQGEVLEMMAKADWGRIDRALTGRLAAAVTDAAQWIKKQALPGEAQVNPTDVALELLAGWSVEGQAAMGGVKLKPAQRQELMAQTRRQMRRFWNYGVRQLVPDASLPADVLAKKREMMMNQGLSNEVALDIGKRALMGKPKLSDLVVGEAQQNPEIRRKMFLAMNPRIDSGVTMASLNPEERRVAEALLKLRDDLGKRMVKAGRIGLQTYEAMREGTSHYYDRDVKREKSLLRQMSMGLRNLFAQTATAYHIVDTQTKQPDGSPVLVMHPGTRNRPTYRFDTQEQMRGFYEEFIKEQILQAAEKGNAQRYPWMTPADKAALMGVTRDSLNNPGRMSAEQRAVVARLQEQLRARFEKRIPLTYDEHSQAGLIEDPFYSVARQIAEMGHDVATAEFFNYIDSVPDYVRDAPTIGYTEMPDTAKLGALAGKYVRDDVAAEVQQLTELPGLGLKFYDALMGLFKTGKTVLNPGSHGRNVVGNIAFAHLAGSNPLNPGNWAYYTDALRVLREGGADYREMYENGVLGGDFLTGEVKRSLRQLVPDAATVLREAKNGNMTWLYGLKEHMARRWQGLLKTPGKALDLAATAWRFEDDIYKAAAYLKAKSMGMSSKEAAEHVREWFPYYDKGTSGTLRALGRFAFPFLSFKRESFRILKNGLTKKPLATIATLALPRMLTQIALTMAEMRLLMWTLGLGLKDERDKEDVLKALKGRAGRLLSPIAGDTSLFSILLPWRDENGGLQQWDLSNTHPFGDWLATRIEDAESKEPWLARQAREMLTGSPFLSLLVESAFNKDAFTGRRIYEDDMSADEATGKLVEHAFSELAPPITPTVSLPGSVKLEGTSARTIRKAFEQSPSKLAPARNPTQAVIRALVGLDVRPADPNLYEDVAEYREKNHLPSVPRGQQFPSNAVGRARAELYRLLIQPEVDVPAVKAQLEVLAKHGAKIPSVQDLFEDRQPQDVMKLKKHQARWMNQLPPEARRVLEAAQKQQSGAKPKALDAMAKARADRGEA